MTDYGLSHVACFASPCFARSLSILYCIKRSGPVLNGSASFCSRIYPRVFLPFRFLVPSLASLTFSLTLLLALISIVWHPPAPSCVPFSIDLPHNVARGPLQRVAHQCKWPPCLAKGVPDLFSFINPSISVCSVEPIEPLFHPVINVCLGL